MSKKRARGGGDIRQFFGQSQKIKKTMNIHCKEEREQSGLDMNNAQITTKSFQFCHNKNLYNVICDLSKTIEEALHTNDTFKAIYERNQQAQMVIERRKSPVSTVTPDFPLCLIDENEILDIKFKSADRKNSTNKKASFSPDLMAEREKFVSFYIATRGGKKGIIRILIEQNDLRETDYVCVYALKGETVEEALQRDGRFKEDVFKKGILLEKSSKSFTNLTNTVEDLDGKSFTVTLNLNQTKAQISAQKNEKHKDPEIPQATATSKDSTNTPEKKAETPQEEKPRKYPETKEIPNTQEILKLLREQHKDLLKTLKERENLKNNAEVKRFFRVEYDKSVHSFSEVKRVKKLMEFSDSVCQIRINGFSTGTGFLLFDRFVLTNAHVVGEYDPFTRRLHKKFTAVFEFEDLTSIGKVIPVKEILVAVFHGKDDMSNHLDFALLELEEEENEKELSNNVKLPELLKYYSAPPSRGGVCIIGHPEGGVKQMDPCFIIAKENVPQEAERYYRNNQNPQVYQVITRWGLNELNDSAYSKSQINYNSCFFHGSSGSPVFDEDCNLIGVHTGGYVYPGEGKTTRSVMEFGLPMFPILEQIFIQCSKSERSDVVQKLNPVLEEAKEELQGNEPMDTSN